MRRHVLILGADGFIGRHIASAARRAGLPVTPRLLPLGGLLKNVPLLALKCSAVNMERKR